MFSKSEYQYEYTTPVDVDEQFAKIGTDYKTADANRLFAFYTSQAPVAFGGTDTAQRDQQISFLERMAALFKVQPSQEALKSIPTDKLPLPKDLQLMQLRLLTMVGLYIKDQIRAQYPHPHLWTPRRSKLYSFVAEYLNIVDGNRPDDNEAIQREIIAQALLFFSDQASFYRANRILTNMKREPFTATEYQDFVRYLQEKAKPHESLKRWTEKPFEIAASYTLQTAGEIIGTSAGFLLGGVLSTSAPMIPVNIRAAKMVAQGMIMAGMCSTMGAPIVAPIIAAKLLAVLCEVALALTLKSVGGIVGKQAGRAIGIPLDALTRAGTKFSLDIYGRLTRVDPSKISGIRLSDGARVVNGIVQVDDSTPQEDMGMIEFLDFDDQGNVTHKGQVVVGKDELMAELIKTLTARGMMPSASADPVELARQESSLQPH